jgi:hypothetical protein
LQKEITDEVAKQFNIGKNQTLAQKRALASS